MTIADITLLPNLYFNYIGRNISSGEKFAKIVLTNQETKDSIDILFPDAIINIPLKSVSLSLSDSDFRVFVKEITSDSTLSAVIYDTLDDTNTPIFREMIVFSDSMESTENYEQYNSDEEYIFIEDNTI